MKANTEINTTNIPIVVEIAPEYGAVGQFNTVALTLQVPAAILVRVRAVQSLMYPVVKVLRSSLLLHC
jgi:hypothetical protein